VLDNARNRTDARRSARGWLGIDGYGCTGDEIAEAARRELTGS
jgi:hypothetical protein